MVASPTRTAIQAMLAMAVLVAAAWFILAPSPEPAIAVLMAAVGVLSMRLSRPDAPERSEEGPGDDAAAAAPVPPADRSRVAVLPLDNIAGEPGQEYLADGLTEELISVLSRVGGLQVIARSSVASYRGRRRPIADIARELGVGAVLEGSVRVSGDHLRVAVRLIDTASESQLWSGDYDRELREVFAVQTAIAREVADALEVSIVQTESTRLAEVPTTDLEAYDLYLLGRHDLNRRTEAGLRRSLDRFRAAVEQDPSFAAAHAGIADAYVLALLGYAPIPRQEAMGKARASSEKAIAAQETLADAHTSRGFVLMNFDWEWSGAEAEFERAIELNPSDARAYQWFAQCKSYQGRFEDAIPLVEKAVQLDPRSPLIATEAGWPFMYLGRDEEALARFRRALDLDPDFALAHFNIGNIHELAGNHEEALRKYRKAADLSGDAPLFALFAARALALIGREQEARMLLADARTSAAGALSPVYIARVHEALGEPQQALALLERALTERDPMIIGIHTRWLALDRLAGMPRYEAVLAELPVTQHS